MLGAKGKNPSPSTTCEEASPFSVNFYIVCGKAATKQVFHPRDKKTYAMCEACASHNVKNRGAVLLEDA